MSRRADTVILYYFIKCMSMFRRKYKQPFRRGFFGHSHFMFNLIKPLLKIKQRLFCEVKVKALRCALLCVIRGAAFADQICLDLSGIFKLTFDTLYDVAGD